MYSWHESKTTTFLEFEAFENRYHVVFMSNLFRRAFTILKLYSLQLDFNQLIEVEIERVAACDYVQS